MAEEKDFIPPATDSGGTVQKEATPLEKFEFWLKDLAGCGSWLINIIVLDHSGMDVLAADDSEAFPLKLKCDHAARNRVAAALSEAEEKMAARTHAPGEGSVYHNFKRHYDARLEGLRERLEAMRTPENSATMDQIRLYLTASVIHGKARKLSDSLAGVYRLRGIGDYCDRIRYDAYDPGTGEAGLARLIGKAFTRYGFTCYEAIRAIEEDTQAALNKFQEDFNSQIQEEILVGIVEPIQAILSRLQTRASQLSA